MLFSFWLLVFFSFFMLLLVGISSLSTTVLYALFLSLIISALFLFTGNSFFMILCVYLFVGGLLCVIVVFASFSWGLVTKSNFLLKFSFIFLLMLFSVECWNTEKRFSVFGGVESGSSWEFMFLLPVGFVMIMLILFGMKFYIPVGSGPVRFFSF